MKKVNYLEPEIEVIKLQAISILAGTTDEPESAEGDAKQGTFTDEEEDGSVGAGGLWSSPLSKDVKPVGWK